MIVSISFVAGAYGRKIVEVAGEKLLRKAREEARYVAKEEAIKLVGNPAAVAYTYAARDALNSGEPLDKVFGIIQLALQNDPHYAGAYVEKGRVLKRQGKIEEALAAAQRATELNPEKPEALYNRACYSSILGRAAKIVADDLEKAIKLRPKLKEIALTDHDLDNVRNSSEIKRILENPAEGNRI